MRSQMFTGLLLFVLIGLPGCKSVVSDHLIGVPLEAEQAQLCEGTWRMNDGVLYVKHTDGANLLVAMLEWDDDKGEFQMKQLHVTITTHQDARFVQMDAEEDDDEQEAMEEDSDPKDTTAGSEEKSWLLLGMLSSSGNDALVLYGPDFGRFKRALDEGQIQAELSEDGNTLHIKGDKASLDALVNPDTLLELFDMENPGVITRVGKVE